MGKADILIDVHPDLEKDARSRLADNVAHLNGVLEAHFDPQHPGSHALHVEYDPGKISSEAILKEVKIVDPKADMAGL